jgi:hypothetical protein
MRRSLKVLFVGVGILAAIGTTAVLGSSWDGRYALTIVQAGNKFSLRGKPDPIPYFVDDFTGHIEWAITNGTSDDSIRIRLDNFTCDAGPLDCPLRLNPRGTIDCTSDDVAIPQGPPKFIMGDVNAAATCRSNGPFGDIWEYRFVITTSHGIFVPDPELEIDRGYLAKVVARVRRSFGLIRRLAHF